MIETIDQMIADIIRREGGYVNNPADNGGPTNFGITLATARKHGYPDVKLITPSIAHDIMLDEYFVQPRLNRAPAELQAQLFDISVNSGAGVSVKLLQRALVSFEADIPIDGDLGPTTAAAAADAVKTFGSKVVEDAIVAERVSFYRDLVQRNPAEEAFLKGWLARANGFEV